MRVRGCTLLPCTGPILETGRRLNMGRGQQDHSGWSGTGALRAWELSGYRGGSLWLCLWHPRVHGSYEHLWAGQVADALVDLTGGLAERWNLKGPAGSSRQQDRPTGGQEHRTCWQMLRLKDRCLISCSVLSPRAGARVMGEFHAFIVSDLQELQSRAGQGILLLRILNPWGRQCWQGLWREGGEGWSQLESTDEARLLSQLQDGEFWVEEGEFLREFDEVTISYPVTEAGHLQSLYTERTLCHARALPGAWVKGQSAGGCRNNSCFPSNPKFWLHLSEPSEVCVAVLQRPQRRTEARARPLLGHGAAPASLSGKDYQAVGLHIWKVEKRRVSLPRVLSAPPVAGTVCHAYDREVHLRCELSPGRYLAVPSTFLKGVSAQFLLRVFSTGKMSLSRAERPAAQGTDPRAALPADQVETMQLRGCWKAGWTAGGSRNFASYPCNPCLPFSVPEGAGPRCVRITLQQHCRLGDSQLHPIGFHVFQVREGAESQDVQSLLLQEPLLSCVPHRYAQEVSRLCLLATGTYRVVPSTYLPDAEGAFTVIIATSVDRRSIHSQEVLGRFLQEVRVPPCPRLRLSHSPAALVHVACACVSPS
ncbi:calpain-10 isoform X4 [Heterocephalus glaber]|uniref:Calpain-10 n=1 Tax=Heterocephalus glaber TaxID=10181 RepID=A0AAX6RYW8_HETGA|nr:calpain-10 isoform X4 [Heterocephalus glaber]XP_021102972.1 calpain-10 isoform X4 [Heterocephalus glaber]